MDTTQVYFAESVRVKSLSLRNQFVLFMLGSSRRSGTVLPFFSHLYVIGGTPSALHLSRIECEAGHAMNFRFISSGSVKYGSGPLNDSKRIYVMLA